LSVVREYLRLEFQETELPFPFDFERIVDDIVFLLFLCGNDFLPHLPSLQIREGAIDMLFMIYKNLLPSFEGYITKEGKIDLRSLDIFLQNVSQVEDELFQKQQMQKERMKERDERNK